MGVAEWRILLPSRQRRCGVAKIKFMNTLNNPAWAKKGMERKVFETGKYLSPWNQEQYPRIQILTVEQLLADDSRPNPHIFRMPPSYAGETFKQAAKAKTDGRSQQLEVL